MFFILVVIVLVMEVPTLAVLHRNVVSKVHAKVEQERTLRTWILILNPSMPIVLYHSVTWAQNGNKVTVVVATRQGNIKHLFSIVDHFLAMF